MSVVRCRVEVRGNGESDNALKRALSAMRTQRREAGIDVELKRTSRYESNGQKRRRKKKESEALRLKEAREGEEKLKEKLRDYFG